MSTVKRILIENACYHLMTRGNQRQSVFKGFEDYEVYLFLLRKFKRKYKFRIYAYCLMPNHIHILGQAEVPRLLSKFMAALNRTYTEYFNRKYEKVGHLWQGRFKSKIIQKDQYLLDCFQYIETNPIRSGLANSPSDYQWSSHRERTLNTGDRIIDQPEIC